MSDISVVIPAYNVEAFLGQAIESILAQRDRPREVIVVNDGSTDGTRDAALAYASQGVRCIDQPHARIGAAVNRGLAEANSPLIAFLDADDLWTGDKLDVQLPVLKGDPLLEAVFGWSECFGELAADGGPSPYEVPEGSGPWYCKSTMLIRREALDRVGPFNEEVQVGDFVDWYLRAQEIGLRSLMIPKVIHRRRIHKTNNGILCRDSRADYVRLLKASLDRRRQA